MKRKIITDKNCLKILRIIYLTSIYLFVYLCIYEIFKFYRIDNIFFVIPISVWLLIKLGKNIIRYDISEEWNIGITIVSFFILCIIANSVSVNQFYTTNLYTLLTIFTEIFFISLLMLKICISRQANAVSIENSFKEDLFNLFYINTSKVHEIAMLIDNKIMKTIEREQISEELLKSKLSTKDSMLLAETSIEKENNYKKRIYENFDVKTTKSIMLRKLYEVAKNSNDKAKSILPGQLIIFKDVELKRRNVDDTVMLLNVLKDSKLKNQGNNNIEINMNKMMETVLDDFTIDYQFEQDIFGDDKTKCLIQFPYNSNENFENGYQHNDLQLGKLSIVGIYRGKIDFSKRESVSAKFLDILSNSYKTEEYNKIDGIIKDSFIIKDKNMYPFEFKSNKLTEQMHLIDVIAIIQELNINKEI